MFISIHKLNSFNYFNWSKKRFFFCLFVSQKGFFCMFFSHKRHLSLLTSLDKLDEKYQIFQVSWQKQMFKTNQIVLFYSDLCLYFSQEVREEELRRSSSLLPLREATLLEMLPKSSGKTSANTTCLPLSPLKHIHLSSRRSWMDRRPPLITHTSTATPTPLQNRIDIVLTLTTRQRRLVRNTSAGKTTFL